MNPQSPQDFNQNPQPQGINPTPSLPQPASPAPQPQYGAPQPYTQPQNSVQQPFAQPASQQPQVPFPILPENSYRHPEQAAELPIDYLNAIAAPKKSSSMFAGKKKWLFIGLLVALLLSFGLMIANGLSSTKSPATITTLFSTMTNLQSAIKTNKENTKSTTLDAANANLEIFLTNAIRDYTQKVGISAEKIDKNLQLLAKNELTKINKELEDADLNATFDRVYANEMSRELELILSLLKNIEKKTTNAEFKKLIKKQIDDLSPIQQIYQKF